MCLKRLFSLWAAKRRAINAKCKEETAEIERDGMECLPSYFRPTFSSSLFRRHHRLLDLVSHPRNSWALHIWEMHVYVTARLTPTTADVVGNIEKLLNHSLDSPEKNKVSMKFGNRGTKNVEDKPNKWKQGYKSINTVELVEWVGWGENMWTSKQQRLPLKKYL